MLLRNVGKPTTNIHCVTSQKSEGPNDTAVEASNLADIIIIIIITNNNYHIYAKYLQIVHLKQTTFLVYVMLQLFYSYNIWYM